MAAHVKLNLQTCPLCGRLVTIPGVAAEKPIQRAMVFPVQIWEPEQIRYIAEHLDEVLVVNPGNPA